jgi:hypothetical protein
LNDENRSIQSRHIIAIAGLSASSRSEYKAYQGILVGTACQLISYLSIGGGTYGSCTSHRETGDSLREAPNERNKPLSPSPSAYPLH